VRDILRDPIWQAIGVFASVYALIVTCLIAYPPSSQFLFNTSEGRIAFVLLLLFPVVLILGLASPAKLEVRRLEPLPGDESSPALMSTSRQVLSSAFRMIHMAFMRPISLAQALANEAPTGIWLDASRLISIALISLVLLGLILIAMVLIGFPADLVMGVRLTTFAIIVAATHGACLWHLAGRPAGITATVVGLTLAPFTFGVFGTLVGSATFSLLANGLLAFFLGSILSAALAWTVAIGTEIRSYTFHGVLLGLFAGILLGTAFSLTFDVIPGRAFGPSGDVAPAGLCSIAAVAVYIVVVLANIMVGPAYVGALAGLILSAGLFVGFVVAGLLGFLITDAMSDAIAQASIFLIAFSAGYYRIGLYLTEAALFGTLYLMAKWKPESARVLFGVSPVFSDEVIWLPLPFLYRFFSLACPNLTNRFLRQRRRPFSEMLLTYREMRVALLSQDCEQKHDLPNHGKQ
jgi:hypothetical protein